VVDIGSPKQERSKCLEKHSTLVGGVPVDGATAFEAGVCFSVEVKVSCVVLKKERLEYKKFELIVNQFTKTVEKARCNKTAKLSIVIAKYHIHKKQLVPFVDTPAARFSKIGGK